jgi:hypothetical protein
MARTTAFITGYLNLFFKNIAFAGIGDSNGIQPSGAPGNLYWALFTADPTVSGSIVNEANYGGYARQPAVRGSGFTVTGGVVSNATEIDFPKCTSGSSVCTYAALMSDLSGATMLMSGILSAGGLNVTVNIVPTFVIGALTVTPS